MEGVFVTKLLQFPYHGEQNLSCLSIPKDKNDGNKDKDESAYLISSSSSVKHVKYTLQNGCPS